MQEILYYGQPVIVSDEVAEFLEQDRRREEAQRKKDERHLQFVDTDLPMIPSLLTDTPSDPTFWQVYQKMQKQSIYRDRETLPDDDRKLLELYFYQGYTMEQIGAIYGVSKMAISKRIRKVLDRLRDLMEK